MSVPGASSLVQDAAGTQGLVSSVGELVLQLLRSCPYSVAEEAGWDPSEGVEPVLRMLHVCHDANTGLNVQIISQSYGLGHGEPGVTDTILLGTG